MSIIFKPTLDALKNLEEVLSISKPSDLERNGTIQRFEYSYELIWKLAQRVLKENEIETDTPRNIFKQSRTEAWVHVT